MMQRNTCGECGDEPFALVGLERWQEERKHLPQDYRRCCNDRCPEGNLELDRERVKCVEELQVDIAILTQGKEIGNREQQELTDCTRCQIENADSHEQDDDDAHETHAQLAKMLHQGHARRTDRHYSSPPSVLADASDLAGAVSGVEG